MYLNSPSEQDLALSETSPLVEAGRLEQLQQSRCGTVLLVRCIGVNAIGILLLLAGIWKTRPHLPNEPDFLGDVFRPTTTIKVAFAGNSMQYYQDLPRLLEQMLRTKYDEVVQDSCFQGLSTIESLWSVGNTVNETFHTKEARKPDGTYDIGSATVSELLMKERDWNFLVLNDLTQSPARLDSRRESEKALAKCYAPILRDRGITLILLETAAYEYNIHNSSDLGGFDEFTRLIHEGYVEYMAEMQQLNCSTRLAPTGLAFSYVRYHMPELFHKLYASDHHHPSPHGTWMEACIVYCTMLNEMPPRYNVDWWVSARYVIPGLALPTDTEAESIRQVAAYICEI